jgi:hypothetical protein
MFAIAAFGYLFGFVDLLRRYPLRYDKFWKVRPTRRMRPRRLSPQQALPPRKYRLKAVLWK